MKKIINGKVYNTKTATLIGAGNNFERGPLSERCFEFFFLKDNGECFVYGSGGSSTPYAKRGEEWGMDIRPLTRKQALNWFKERAFEWDYLQSWLERLPNYPHTK